jgi:hypothetical protein
MAFCAGYTGAHARSHAARLVCTRHEHRERQRPPRPLLPALYEPKARPLDEPGGIVGGAAAAPPADGAAASAGGGGGREGRDGGGGGGGDGGDDAPARAAPALNAADGGDHLRRASEEQPVRRVGSGRSISVCRPQPVHRAWAP